MTNKLSLFAVVIAFLALGFAGTHQGGNAPQPKKETVFERVMRTNTLRCGYVIVDPGLMKDPKTGAFSGPVYDIMSDIGRMLNLKIEWTEETNFATAVTGLQMGRYDEICTTLFWRPNLMRLVELVQPYYYIPIQVVQRVGEKRFKKKEDMDVPEIKIASVDGAIPMLIADDDFKKAKLESLPETSPYNEILFSLVYKKADVTFVDPLFFHHFDDANPGKVEINKDIPPLRVFGVTFAVLKGEHDLANMLSNAIVSLRDNGRIEQILGKYDPKANVLLRDAPAYVLHH